ncbi:OsmC family peroxiredoxin [Brevibacterium sp. 5221]|uniref:OsmC family peroxiredoxin n=1 Tax=Brevibacterium rongguiense TaxID=2695267 RepID=A0A6N9H621_9MICO|nr:MULTISPECIES: OsmC family peroxiredoxin [Brevibacterium]MYM19186.1 OsmC family peroxiredoxin [Brevibacterium rongguiense]WAL40864.1 OsmC family peroxiredoxin [Brevibacterium sp. BRM-1]
MPTPLVSKASAVWRGSLLDGSGTVALDTSGAANLQVNWKARAEEHQSGVTSPEELLGAAHAACYSMALSNVLAENGTPASDISTGADVTFDVDKGITEVHLVTVARVEGLTAADFVAAAERAKRECPVSRALKGTNITLSADLG